MNGDSALFGIQPTTGYAQNTANSVYTASVGFVPLNTFFALSGCLEKYASCDPRMP